MHAPQRPPVAPLRCSAAAVVQWASRGLQPDARARRSGELLLSRGRAALRRTTPAAAAAAMDWGPYGEPTTVVHLTGLRLFADEARTDARGVAPAAAVAAVLRAAAAEKPAPAAVIITGDVASDRSAGAYALAKRLVRAAFPTTRVCFLPGCVTPLTGCARARPPLSARDPPRAQARRRRGGNGARVAA
jgi:hypothetical protein